MYGKVVNLKFANMEEAKLAASFFTENIASKISVLKIVGFNVFIGKQGDLNLLVKFEDVSSIKLFEQKYPQIKLYCNESDEHSINILEKRGYENLLELNKIEKKFVNYS